VSGRRQWVEATGWGNGLVLLRRTRFDPDRSQPQSVEEPAMSQTIQQLPASLSLQGRRVLVTGAASGIGRATALALAQLGAEVVLSDRAALADVQAEVEASGGACTAQQGDLTSDAFIDSLFAGGRIHALAHCAAILEGRNWREDRNWHERFQRVMDINVRVPLTLAGTAIDHMGGHGGGSIVLIGSVAGRTGGTSLSTPPDYSASKGAVHALVKWLSRQAVGRGVLVNGVAPGPVQTPMTTGFVAGTQLPLGRMGRPDELAWPIAFLCTPAASYFSGAILDVNGGTFVG
jgi:3-oxoacyl-[acyl-carrier protein] reductase